MSLSSFRILDEQANNSKPHERRGSGEDREEKQADAAAAAAANDEAGGANARVQPTAPRGGAGGGGGEYLGYTGTDPVTGQLVRSGELVKASPAEVADYLKRYNELDDGEEGREKDGAPGGRDTGAAAGSAAGGGGRGVVNEAFGVDDGRRAGDAGDHKNGEGRAKDSAPVASAGGGAYRGNHNAPAAG